MTSAEETPEIVIVREDFADSLIKYFDNLGGLRPNHELHVDCSICGHELALMGEADASIETETATALPCGHLFGLNCIKDWLPRGEDCPKCRRPMLHACGHFVRLPKIVGSPNFSPFWDLPGPLLNYESVGEINCAPCRENAWVTQYPFVTTQAYIEWQRDRDGNMVASSNPYPPVTGPILDAHSDSVWASVDRTELTRARQPGELNNPEPMIPRTLSRKPFGTGNPSLEPFSRHWLRDDPLNVPLPNIPWYMRPSNGEEE